MEGGSNGCIEASLLADQERTARAFGRSGSWLGDCGRSAVRHRGRALIRVGRPERDRPRRGTGRPAWARGEQLAQSCGGGEQVTRCTQESVVAAAIRGDAAPTAECVRWVEETFLAARAHVLVKERQKGV